MMEGFEVRPAEAGDAEGVSMLVSGMPNSMHIQVAVRPGVCVPTWAGKGGVYLWCAIQPAVWSV